MSVRVNIRYRRASARLLNWVRSATGGPEVAETLTYVSMDVETGLQSTMPARSRTSRVNWRWVRKNSSAWCCMETPQEVVKRAEVLHSEFPLEGRYGVLQERCARCGENNVINIK
jgi:hypothetical protein